MKNLTVLKFEKKLNELLNEQEFRQCNIKVTEIEISFPNGDSEFFKNSDLKGVINKMGETHVNFDAVLSYSPASHKGVRFAPRKIMLNNKG